MLVETLERKGQLQIPRRELATFKGWSSLRETIHKDLVSNGTYHLYLYLNHPTPTREINSFLHDRGLLEDSQSFRAFLYDEYLIGEDRPNKGDVVLYLDDNSQFGSSISYSVDWKWRYLQRNMRDPLLFKPKLGPDDRYCCLQMAIDFIRQGGTVSEIVNSIGQLHQRFDSYGFSHPQVRHGGERFSKGESYRNYDLDYVIFNSDQLNKFKITLNNLGLIKEKDDVRGAYLCKSYEMRYRGGPGSIILYVEVDIENASGITSKPLVVPLFGAFSSGSIKIDSRNFNSWVLPSLVKNDSASNEQLKIIKKRLSDWNLILGGASPISALLIRDVASIL